MADSTAQFWWLRIATDFEEYYGPFKARSQAQKCGERFKCDTEVLQDSVIDGSYLELCGGEVGPPSRNIVMRSGRMVPFSQENMYEWARREYGL